MNELYITHLLSHFSKRRVIGFSIAAVIFAAVLLFTGPVRADNQRAITIYDGEKSLTVTTTAKTVGEVLERADIKLDERDSVEPSRDTPLLSPAYTVNVYRARPVTIIDNGTRTKVMSSHRSARSIVIGAGIPLKDADTVEMKRIDNFVSGGGPGVKVEIDRSVTILLVLNGVHAEVDTQADTVGEFLEEKNISLGLEDGLSKPKDTPITEGMILDVYSNGVPTRTIEQPISFETRYIQDANRKVGYREVKEAGQNGRRVVTYQVATKHGKQTRVKELHSIVLRQPKQKIVVVGVKVGFSGDFAEALAKLRSCEGGYDSWNQSGPYYGAYQFDEDTWAGAAPSGAEYGNATPAEQDQAARNLYERRGWSPWPVCGASLPDIYR